MRKLAKSIGTIALATTMLSSAANAANYDIGVGIYDITGQVAETNFMGWAELFFRNAGIRDRQYARAYIVKDDANKSVVFVSVDKGAMFQAVNEAVMAKLQANFGDLYTDDNVVISATHTHQASGGQSHYGLYVIATGGYWKTNFNNMVDGIYESIVRAHNNIAPGDIYMNSGALDGASVNRSLRAYVENVDADDFSPVDNEMTVLRFEQGGTDVGMISWFPVHPTSLGKEYKYNSGDSKGYASLKFERDKESSYGTSGSFVAAFAQSNAGDLSGNLNLPPYDTHDQPSTGPGSTTEESSEIIGELQYQKAVELFNSANVKLSGPVSYVSRYNDFSNTEVDGSFTDGQTQTTCKASIGFSFAAGAEDGRSGLFREGLTKDPNWGTANDQCHAEKPVFLFTGSNGNNPDTPKILPTSLVKIGQLGILAAPAEFTAMAGRRSKAAVNSVAGNGLDHLVFAGYADAYAGYVTTEEEYRTQQYEGASTHFGPWTLAAYRQEFQRLATKLADPNSNPWPNSEPAIQAKSTPGDATVTVLFDDKPWYRSFGDMYSQPSSNASQGSTVKAVYWGGHPNNDLKTNDTYLKVEHKVGGQWVTYATDRDVQTKMIWKRVGLSYSHITVEWTIPSDAPSGTYRLRHYGKWKNGWTGSLNNYSGKSNNISVN